MKFKRIAQYVLEILSSKPIDAGLYLIIAIAMLKLGSLYFDVTDGGNNWDKFKIDYKCKLQKSGNQQSGWLCNDGKIYYHWRQQR